MEFLVTMTTEVPEGTTETAVDDVRRREAAHSAGLVAHGQLLRLWRPPLQPGEWRTLGLFVAEDGPDLEHVLSSMPLRVWRHDAVTPLSPHPNDPAPARRRSGDPEFLTTFTIMVPAGTSAEAVGEADAREAERTHELAVEGHLRRLWSLPDKPGEPQALGLWEADGPLEMHAILDSLPLAPWMTVETTPLSHHPSDPG